MLIKCEECGTEVSNKASSCIACGNPFAESSQGVSSPTTIQQTGKAYKGHQAIAGIVVIVGMIMMISADGADRNGSLGAMVMAIGAIWFIGARMGAWWNHG